MADDQHHLASPQHGRADLPLPERLDLPNGQRGAWGWIRADGVWKPCPTQTGCPWLEFAATYACATIADALGERHAGQALGARAVL